MNKVIEKELLQCIDNIGEHVNKGASMNHQEFYETLNDLVFKLLVRRKVITMMEKENKKVSD
jgi:hypothetical protein